MMRCESCGCMLKEGAVACPGCGMKTEKPGMPAGAMAGADLRYFVFISRPGRPGETAVAGVSAAAPTVVVLPERDALGHPVTMIAPEAFRGRPLSAIHLPDTVDTIGREAFAACTRLCRVTGGAGVQRVAEGAFLGCFLLENCDFLEERPDRGKADVALSAFAGCYTLTLAGENR